MRQTSITQPCMGFANKMTPGGCNMAFKYIHNWQLQTFSQDYIKTFKCHKIIVRILIDYGLDLNRDQSVFNW